MSLFCSTLKETVDTRGRKGKLAMVTEIVVIVSKQLTPCSRTKRRMKVSTVKIKNTIAFCSAIENRMFNKKKIVLECRERSLTADTVNIQRCYCQALLSMLRVHTYPCNTRAKGNYEAERGQTSQTRCVLHVV